MVSWNNENIFVHLIDLDTSIKAFTKYIGKEDIYIIVVNSRLNIEQQLLAIKHELLHIKNRDFENNSNVNEIESNNLVSLNEYLKAR